MFHRTKAFTRLLAGILFALVAASPAAADKSEFAEHHYVLQISDSDPFKQTLVLNVAGNILDHYGPDLVDIEVVAFGPGLRLLFEGNANADRIDSLAAQGVEFSACSNTQANMSRMRGNDVALNEHADVVPAGAVRIGELVEDGWVLLKP
jgi:hypothetical protein